MDANDWDIRCPVSGVEAQYHSPNSDILFFCLDSVHTFVFYLPKTKTENQKKVSAHTPTVPMLYAASTKLHFTENFTETQPRECRLLGYDIVLQPRVAGLGE